MKEFFLKEKPVMALVTIRRQQDEIYCSVVSKKIGTTYAHTVKTISRMEEKNLVISKRSGGKKLLELTSKGERVADSLLDLLQSFEEDNY